jgi:hypothetical protein
MLPLFIVYFSEYAMQSGTWAAIGFPVEDEGARKKFYEYANWLYQAGVFVSRSSGTLVQANMLVLQLMPVLQTALLVLFTFIAVYQFLYGWGLLAVCFVVGLLGGGVYAPPQPITRASPTPPRAHSLFCFARPPLRARFARAQVRQRLHAHLGGRGEGAPARGRARHRERRGLVRDPVRGRRRPVPSGLHIQAPRARRREDDVPFLEKKDAPRPSF